MKLGQSKLNVPNYSYKKIGFPSLVYLLVISACTNVKVCFEWLRDNDSNNGLTILCDRGERYFSCL